MRVVFNGARKPCAHGLCFLSLSVLVLHCVLAQTEELDDLGSVCTDASSAVTGDQHVAGVTRSECQARSVPHQDVKGSLLQVKSEMHSQPSTASLVDSDSNSASSHLDHQPGSVTALLAFSEAVHRSVGRYPTVGLVALAIVVSICVVGIIVHLVNDHLYGDDNSSAARGSPGPYQGGSRPSSVDSLGPTPLASQRATPPASQRNVPSGNSPLPLNRPPSQQGPPMVAAARHLCPGLVVPHGNECILAVSALPPIGTPSLDIAALNVQDLDGSLSFRPRSSCRALSRLVLA